MERSGPLTSGCQGWKAFIQAAGQVMRVKPNGMRGGMPPARPRGYNRRPLSAGKAFVLRAGLFSGRSLASPARYVCRRRRAACVRHKRAEVWQVKAPVREGRQARRYKAKPPRRAHPAGDTQPQLAFPSLTAARKLHRPAGQSGFVQMRETKSPLRQPSGMPQRAGRMMYRAPQGKPFACLRGPGMQTVFYASG